MAEKGTAMWPTWPVGANSTRLVDVKVSCSANELFILLWGPNSPYVVSPFGSTDPKALYNE